MIEHLLILVDLSKWVAQRKYTFTTFIGIILVIAITLSVIYTLREIVEKSKSPTEARKAEKYEKAAIATDAEICSKIGAKILKENGSAIDAAIAAMFCAGVVNPHSCGVGGGSFLVYYNRKNKKFTIYDFRETAPSSSNDTMFLKNSNLSRYGGLASGVPGQVKGLWEMHRNHGKLPWKKLVEPSINLAREGFAVTMPVHTAIKTFQNSIHMSPGLKKILIKADGTFLTVDDTLKNAELAKTLETIRDDPLSFYNGDLATLIVQDIKNASGNITLDDLRSYEVKKRDVVTLTLPDLSTLNTMSAPGSGAILAMIYNIMSGYNFSKAHLSNLEEAVVFYQRLIESMKFSFAQRGFLADPDFGSNTDITKVYDKATNRSYGKSIRDNMMSLNTTHNNVSYYGGAWGKDDFGTSHMSILAENGDAVSSTSSINFPFGSLVRSETTGIIYNNQMNDFSTPGQLNIYALPPAKANFITPGKRPLSSMAPTIILDKNGDVKMIAGASGGSRVISGTAEVIMKTLILGAELGEAVTSFRLHHQGVPNRITYSKNTPTDMRLIEKLKRIGHHIKEVGRDSVVQAILRDNKDIYAMSDPRKYSKPDGY